MTPARVSLRRGSHILELRGRGVPRVIPFSVTRRRRKCRSTWSSPKRR